jgi:hypothetical protein
MAVIPVFEPMAGPFANGSAFIEAPYVPVPNAAWRRGDFLQLVTQLTNGTSIVTPSGGTGALATAAGPTFGAPVSVSSTAAQTNAAGTVTITGVASASAPAISYYVQLTYTATGAESQTGAEFVVNCAPGYVFSVNVPAGTAPAGATNYAFYASIYPSFEVLQQATTTTTATGTAFSASFPLANYRGANRAATNQATNVIGLAIEDSLSDYFTGPGGSFLVGVNSLFGASNQYPPLQPAETFLQYVIRPQFNQLYQVSLVQAYNPALVGTTAGLAIQSNGFFALDTTQSNKIMTIYGSVDGVASVVGNGTETSGKRVLAYFNGGII